MAAKSKQKVEQDRKLRVYPILFPLIAVVILYFGCKTYNTLILYKNKSWLDYVPFLTDYLPTTRETDSLPIFQRDFYSKLFNSIWEDTQLVYTCIYYSVVYLCEIFSSALAVFSLIVIVCVCLSISLYKDSRDQKQKRRTNKKAKEKTGTAAKNGHVCCDHYSESSRSNKLYWKWFTLIVFLAMLLSIPWEFVRMYQSMVAEKVAQMEAGIPPECLPDQTFIQSIKSYIRWYLSWAPDPCLIYHKALIVDPMWQVQPLMVLSSAFSHCIIYPVEVLFGGLGRAFRLFFNEIPAPWQPVMLVIMVVLLVLVLIMAFGYRIHLPLILKFEPKTPLYLRYKSRRDDAVKCEKQNLQFTAPDSQQTESQQSIESSQDTQYTSSQASQDFD